jgi:hypothetical protein
MPSDIFPQENICDIHGVTHPYFKKGQLVRNELKYRL